MGRSHQWEEAIRTHGRLASAMAFFEGGACQACHFPSSTEDTFHMSGQQEVLSHGVQRLQFDGAHHIAPALVISIGKEKR